MGIVPQRYDKKHEPLRIGANPAGKELGYAAGQLGYAERRTATDQVITAGALITGLSVPVIVGANRRIKIIGKLNTFSNGAQPTPDSVSYRILEDGVNVEEAHQNVNNSSEQVMLLATIRTPAPGSHTYTIFGLRNGGGGIITNRSTALQAEWLLVEDIGSAV